jgi:hypothetical protein
MSRGVVLLISSGCDRKQSVGDCFGLWPRNEGHCEEAHGADEAIYRLPWITPISILVFLIGMPTLAQETPTTPSAPPPTHGAAPAAGDGSSWLTPLLGRFHGELYGFVELDAIGDTTESFTEQAANTSIQRPGTYAGDHGEIQFSARHTRFGIRLEAPEVDSIKASAVLEMDFLGNQPLDTASGPLSSAPSPTTVSISEGSYYNYPELRFRHAFIKVETPVVDIIAGQTWELFGWQPYFNPATEDIQGLPGELYSRTPQLRLTKDLKLEAVTLEIAAAALRPPQRDSLRPDGQAGVLLKLNDWRGLITRGAVNTTEDSAAIGVSGILRRFDVAQDVAKPNSANGTVGYGVSVDGMIPIIPGGLKNRSNSLTAVASYVYGLGIGDTMSGLTAGVTIPPLANPTNAYPPPVYPQNVDTGLVTYDKNGELHLIDWQSFLLGLQYYLPPTGKVWITVNYSQMNSDAAGTLFAGSASVWHRSHWFNAALFWEATTALRFTLGYDWYTQDYNDQTKQGSYTQAPDQRVQFSAYYIF